MLHGSAAVGARTGARRNTTATVRRHQRGAAFELAAVVLVCALLLAGIASRPDPSQAQQQTVEVTVRAGDTLWDIAAAHPVSGLTTGEVVDTIMDLNGLRTPVIEPGMLIAVPVTTPGHRTLLAAR